MLTLSMSAFRGKADISDACSNVCLSPLADISGTGHWNHRSFPASVARHHDSYPVGRLPKVLKEA